MKINNKKILIVIITIISLILIKLPRLVINKNNEQLPKVKLKEIKNCKSFAIMISEDGNNYKEYDSNEWPDDKYKFKEAKCIDNKGNLVEDAVRFENGKTSIKTDRTIYCTLYFNIKKPIEVLRENDENEVLSNDLLGGLYRYQGVGEQSDVDITHKFVDNNYICFGTNNKNLCLENEDNFMYRIIGINEIGQLKLIKNTPIDGTYAWNNEKVIVDWPNSNVYNIINSDKYLNNNDYIPINDQIKWKNLIVNYNWLYGKMHNNLANQNGLEVYKIESGIVESQWLDENSISRTGKWDKSIESKVGLMYLHDYYLSLDNETICVIESNLKGNCKKSWLFEKDVHINYAEWLMTNNAYYNDYYLMGATCIYASAESHFHVVDYAMSLRPVIFISEKILISGTGKKDNPYLITSNI